MSGMNIRLGTVNFKFSEATFATYESVTQS